MTEEQQKQLALWRVGVLGPLVSAELEHGDVSRLCKEQAQRCYQKPNGERVKLSWRTLETWHYAYRHGGFAALMPSLRCDTGRSRAIADDIADQIVALKREKPRRSIRRIIRMLERAGKVRKGELKKSSVHRLLRAQGLSKRPAREEGKERRAFRHAFAGDCWMADVMHGPKALDDEGTARKAYLHVFLDSATRFITGAGFRFGERALDFESIFKQAVQQRGLPRVLYVDNGSAQTAESLAIICAELGVYLRHCAPYDPAAKGGVERVIQTIRAELSDELPDEPMPIAELNARLWAWMAREYHRRQHGGTQRVPLEHWLEQAEHLRPAPAARRLRELFLHREQRKVRKDHTVRYRGCYLEVFGPSAGSQIELRYDPEVPFNPTDATTLPAVFAGAEHVCDTVLLRVLKNAQRPRRRIKSNTPKSPVEPTGIDPLTQLVDEQAHVARPPLGNTDKNRE